MMHFVASLATAIAQAYAVSTNTAFGEEVRAGGTRNQAWTFMAHYFLLGAVAAPLYLVFPTAVVILNHGYYMALTIIAALNSLAQIGHDHLHQQPAGDPHATTRQGLRFNLLRNTMFAHLVLRLTHLLTYLLYAAYIGALLLCAYHGLYLFPLAALTMLSVNTLYQKAYFPAFLEPCYRWLRHILLTFAVFGFDSTLTTCLTFGTLAFMIVDYVNTHLRGVTSASVVFPVASSAHFQFSLQQLPEKPRNHQQLTALLREINALELRVTFDHFRDSWWITDKLLANHLTHSDFGLYATLFNQLDFSNPSLRNDINNEMVIHDNFNRQSLKAHCRELNLPRHDVNIVDIQIAYLKREISVLVRRLTHPSYNDLTHQQMNTLRGHARRVLNAIRDPNTPWLVRQQVLLELAIRTGSQCNRAYLDTFAELFQHHGYSPSELTLKERATLDAQSARETCFKHYYYAIIPAWKFLNYGSPTYLLITDTHDFHAYQFFVDYLGAYFYLPNQSLSKTIRHPTDIAIDYLMYYQLKWGGRASNTQLLFSDFYNPAFLVQQTLDPQGKLHRVFQDWCHTAIYPDAYAELMLDDELFPVRDDSSQQALAKLMLLDLGLTESTRPLHRLTPHRAGFFSSMKVCPPATEDDVQRTPQLGSPT